MAFAEHPVGIIDDVCGLRQDNAVVGVAGKLGR